MSALTPHTRETILAYYLEGPSRLQAAVAELSEADLDIGPAPGGWTIREIAHHIVDGDDIWAIAIKAAFGNPETPLTFSWYWNIKQDEWAKHWNYAGRPVEPSLALFAATRQHIAQLLQAQPDAWERCLIIEWPSHPPEHISVREMVEMQARHAHGHIDEILAIRKEHEPEHGLTKEH